MAQVDKDAGPESGVGNPRLHDLSVPS